jgi:hypothetical protein
MVPPARVLALLPLLLGALACVKPDSVELGGACKQQEECKGPADTCMTLGSESLCSMVCSAETACPDGYACARMDVRVEGDDGGAKAGARGYCLADARVGSHIATIKPKGEGKDKSKGKRKAKAKADPEP